MEVYILNVSRLKICNREQIPVSISFHLFLLCLIYMVTVYVNYRTVFDTINALDDNDDGLILHMVSWCGL